MDDAFESPASIVSALTPGRKLMPDQVEFLQSVHDRNRGASWSDETLETTAKHLSLPIRRVKSWISSYGTSTTEKAVKDHVQGIESTKTAAHCLRLLRELASKRVHSNCELQALVRQCKVANRQSSANRSNDTCDDMYPPEIVVRHQVLMYLRRHIERIRRRLARGKKQGSPPSVDDIPDVDTRTCTGRHCHQPVQQPRFKLCAKCRAQSRIRSKRYRARERAEHVEATAALRKMIAPTPFRLAELMKQCQKNGVTTMRQAVALGTSTNTNLGSVSESHVALACVNVLRKLEKSDQRRWKRRRVSREHTVHDTTKSIARSILCYCYGSLV